MGNCSNPYAVTDKKGRVLKVGGLRVSDISLFPSMLFSYLFVIIIIIIIIFCIIVFINFALSNPSR